MYTSSVKKSAINKAKKLGAVAFRHEGKYCVLNEEGEAIPEGAKIIFDPSEEGEESTSPESKEVKAEAKVAPKVEEVKETSPIEVETEKEEIPVKMEKGIDGEVPIGVEIPMETGSHLPNQGDVAKLKSVDVEEEMEEGIIVDPTVSGIEMTDEEVEKELKAPVEKKKKAPASESRKKKITIRQSEPRGAVSVVTADLRQRPILEMVKEIEGSEPCVKIIPTGGAVHAYPKTDEDWAKLMEDTIDTVKKYYPEEEYDIVIDRIK